MPATTIPALIGSGKPGTSGVVRFGAPSYTDASVVYTVSVVCGTGTCHCSCPDFSKRRAIHMPTIWSAPEHLCKHIRDHRQELSRAIAKTLIVVISQVDNKPFKYRLDLYVDGQDVQAFDAMYLHWAKDAEGVRNNLHGIETKTKLCRANISVFDLTGDNVLEVVA